MAKTALPPLDTLDPAAEWAAWEPTVAEPWNAKWAAHLYRRFGFGHTRDELRDAVAGGMAATVDRLFAEPKDSPIRPETVSGPPPVNPMTGMPDASGQAAILRAAWAGRMLMGIQPAREKLALFWHNHFATSVRKVADASFMEKQGELIFTHALGSFPAMLKEISRDPAMLIWLDSNQNVAGKPNENYAREVMELFTLGVGHYTEKDVQAAARAFTGWHTTGGKFTFHAGQHDGAEKLLFGQKGNWDGDDVLKQLLDRPACALFLVRKMYREFVAENGTAPDKLLQPVADAFRKSGYDIRVPATMIARSRHFYSAHAYRQKIKSPVEYVLGTARLVGVGTTGKVIVSPYSLLGALELMGQSLYAPPNVKGWEGGQAWLSTATVLARHNFSNALVNGGGELNEYAKKYNPRGFYPVANPLAMALRSGHTEPAAIVNYFANVLLPDDCRPEVKSKLVAHIGDTDPQTEGYLQKCRDAVFVLLTLPEYQLN